MLLENNQNKSGFWVTFRLVKGLLEQYRYFNSMFCVRFRLEIKLSEHRIVIRPVFWDVFRELSWLKRQSKVVSSVFCVMSKKLRVFCLQFKYLSESKSSIPVM